MIKPKPIWIILLVVSLLLPANVYPGVDFDGTDGYVQIPDSESLDINGSKFSFSAWVKPDFIQTDADNHRIFDKYTTTEAAYQVIFNRTEDDWGFYIYTTSVDIVYTTGVTWTAGTWHHIAGTYDGDLASNQMAIYWDGALEANATQTGVIGENADRLTIGSRNDAGVNALYPFDGQINELAIWDAALTADEVSLLYNSKVKRMPLQIQPANLVLYLPFDDVADGQTGYGQTYNDLSGNANNGTGEGSSELLTGKAEEILSYPGWH